MIGRAAALTNLGDKDRAFRAKKQAFGSFFSLFPVCFSPCRCTLMRRKLRQRQIPSFGRRMVRVCRETDFSGCCFAWKYDGMGTSEKSLPLSKGGLEGMSKRGFLRLLLRPEIGDVGKKPPFVTRVASRAHPLAGCRGAATEAARSAGKGRFGGNVETRISPAVTSPGNTTAWGRRRNPTARGSCSPRSGGKAP